MKDGQVVFVFSDRTWRPGRIVAARSGTRCEVEHIGAPRQTYNVNRLARVSEKRVPSLAALVAYIEQVESLRGMIDIPALWEAVRTEPGDPTFSPEELSELSLPRGAEAAGDAMAWALFGDPVHFKSLKDRRLRPNSALVVEEKSRKLESERRLHREMEEMVEWLSEPEAPGDSPPAKRAIAALRDVALFDTEGALSPVGQRLIRRCFPQDSELDRWIAWRVLVSRGVFSADQNLGLERSGLSTRFEPRVLEEAAQLAAAEVELDRRVDYRRLRTIAIDDRFTTEVDDALAIEDDGHGRAVVHVFITDVAERVVAGGEVDAAARKRAATIYLPEGKVPMIPEVICDDASSLRPGEDRPVLVFKLTLSSTGDILGREVEEGVINLSRRMTYREVDAVLDGAPDPDASTLQWLFQLAEARRGLRRAAGAIILDRAEATVHLEDGVPHYGGYRTDDRSRRMVAEWMIGAGVVAGGWCSERGIPTAYRVQPPPHPRPPVPADRTLAPHEFVRILRSLRRAELVTRSGFHAGLGVSAYSRVTSPLRRYADLLMHRQIKAWLSGHGGMLPEGEVTAVLERLGESLRLHGPLERESRRFWQLRGLEAKVGTSVEGMVVREAGRRVIVWLKGSGIQVPWAPPRAVAIGEEVEVQLESVDARRDRIRLA